MYAFMDILLPRFIASGIDARTRSLPRVGRWRCADHHIALRYRRAQWSARRSSPASSCSSGRSPVGGRALTDGETYLAGLLRRGLSFLGSIFGLRGSCALTQLRNHAGVQAADVRSPAEAIPRGFLLKPKKRSGPKSKT